MNQFETIAQMITEGKKKIDPDTELLIKSMPEEERKELVKIQKDRILKGFTNIFDKLTELNIPYEPKALIESHEDVMSMLFDISELLKQFIPDKYFAIPSNKYMLFILPLFSGLTKRIPKKLLLENHNTKEAKDIIARTLNIKEIGYTDVEDNYLYKTQKQTIAIIQQSSKIKASANVPEELFEDIEGKEAKLAYELKTTFGAVGIKHFLGYLLQLDRSGRNGRFIWNVNRHLELLGYKKLTNRDYDPEAKETAYRILELMTSLFFTIENKNEKGNGTIQAKKIFNISGYDINVKNHRPTGDTNIEVSAEPFWYGGNFQSLKEDGTKQPPQYTKLLEKLVKESAKEHATTLYLAPLFAILWRQNIELNWTLETVLEWIGEPLTGDESNRKRIIKNLETELIYMQKQGYLGECITKSGNSLSYKNLKEVILLQPPKELRKQIEAISSKKQKHIETATRKQLAGEVSSIVSYEEFIDIMKRSGLTQKQFANKLGISTALISKIKKGERAISPELNFAILELINN